MPEPPPSDRTRVRRHADRSRYDAATIEAILDAAQVCHLGVVQDGEPLVMPTGFGRDGRVIYLHGAAANASLGLAGGRPVCVTVTLLDGLVLARTAFNHSVNYRSVVVRGTARPVTDAAEKRRALRVITEHLVPGRWAEVGEPSDTEIASTQVIAVDLGEASAKVRSGPPIDDPGAPPQPWSGVVPLRLVAGDPLPAADATADIPASVGRLRERHR